MKAKIIEILSRESVIGESLGNREKEIFINLLAQELTEAIEGKNPYCQWCGQLKKTIKDSLTLICTCPPQPESEQPFNFAGGHLGYIEQPDKEQGAEEWKEYGKPFMDNVKRIVNADLVIESLESYIELLGKELDEVTPIASVHGWKSNRFEVGKKARRRIDKAKEHYASSKTKK